MKKYFLLVLFILSSAVLLAQPKVDTAYKMGWTPQGTVGINLNQISFSNWVQGGENSLSFSGLANFGLYYKSNSWFNANKLKLAYGRSKTSTKYYTTDNELRLENVIIRNLGWKVNPYFSNEVRTGIANGYDYSTTPETQIIAFFDPGYINQSLGFIYAKKVFNSRIGIGLQETFTNQFTKFSDDPATTEIEKFKIESGIESVSELNYDFLKNMNYTSRLRLFSRFKSLDVWDVNWDNIITAKINDYFNVNFNFNLIYQKDQSLRTQIKEALQLGISYAIF